MSNPDLDIRYLLPDRIEEYMEGLVAPTADKLYVQFIRKRIRHLA